jgi:transcriptional regulator with XRE-family HTH domain
MKGGSSTFGRRARLARKAAGLTVKQVAFAMNWADSNVRSMELGERNNPTLRIIKLLASIYNIKPSQLIDDDEVPEPGPKKRRCLSCNAIFPSDGPHNRICDRCKARPLRIFT